MRVLTVVTDLDKGGVQRTAQNFAEGYAELGHDSRVLAMSGYGSRREQLDAAGIVVHEGWTPATREAIRGWRPDAIHLHAHRLDPDQILEVLDDHPDAVAVEKNVFSWPTPWSGRLRASHQLSAWCLWLYRQRARPLTTQPVVVPNPVNDAAFGTRSRPEVAAFRAEHRIPTDALVLGRVGQAYLSKWSLLLVRLFEELAARRPDLFLLVVNPPDEVAAACRASRFADRTRIIDRIDGDDALSVAYAAMDVFVHLAEGGESFGNVLVEAQLCETPVVTFSTPWADNSQCEVVTNGVGGLVVTTRRGATRAIAALLGDAAMRQRLGRGGAEDVRSRYARRTVVSAAVATLHGDGGPIGSAIDAATIQARYRDAYDRPSAIAVRLVAVPRLRLLVKYLSGFKPWRHLAGRLVVLPARRVRRVLQRRPLRRG